MFGFFKKKKKQQKRSLFDELFPLKEEMKKQIEESVNEIQTIMHTEEGVKELRSYKRNYDSKLSRLQSLEFDTLNWKLHEATEHSVIYYDEFGDTLDLAILDPNGKMEKETLSSQMPNYRNWIRNIAVNQGGGLVYCELFSLENGVTGSESILKVPPKEDTGMDYTYSIMAHHYGEQKLYQIVFRIHEMSPTGMRDNIFLQPISSVLNIDLSELMDLYRQDPYDKNFVGGNVMNLSEREEFDYLFPFHPLSIIRQEIAPKLKQSLRFLE